MSKPITKIRTLTSVASERFAYGVGEFDVPRQIPEARAREFIAAGWAVDESNPNPAQAGETKRQK